MNIPCGSTLLNGVVHSDWGYMPHIDRKLSENNSPEYILPLILCLNLL